MHSKQQGLPLSEPPSAIRTAFLLQTPPKSQWNQESQCTQVHSAGQGGRGGHGSGQQETRLWCWQRAAGAFVCYECCAVQLCTMGWVHVLVPCVEVPSELPEVAAAWFELCAHLPCWEGLYLEHLICVGVLMSCRWAFSVRVSCSVLSHVVFQYS